MLRAPAPYTRKSSIRDLMTGIENKDPSAMASLLFLLDRPSIVTHGDLQFSRDAIDALLAKTESDDGGQLHTLLGILHYRLSAFATAFFYLGGGVALKNSVAMNYVGRMFDNGYGVEMNVETALSWHHKAAAAGNLRAMCDIGYFYQRGRSIFKDQAVAFTWYHKAAEGENPLGMINVSRSYLQGIGVAQNLAAATDWCRKSAATGHPEAIMDLGDLYAKGTGVEKNLIEAARLYRNAAHVYPISSTSARQPYIDRLTRLLPHPAARYYHLTLTQPLPIKDIITLAVATKEYDLLELFFKDEEVTELNKLDLATTITATELQGLPQHAKAVGERLLANFEQKTQPNNGVANILANSRDAKKLDELFSALETAKPITGDIHELRQQLSLLRATVPAILGLVSETYLTLGGIPEALRHPKAAALLVKALFNCLEQFDCLQEAEEDKYLLIAHLLMHVPADTLKELAVILSDAKVIAAQKQLALPKTKNMTHLLIFFLEEISHPEMKKMSQTIAEALQHPPFETLDNMSEEKAQQMQAHYSIVVPLWFQLKQHCALANDLLQQDGHATNAADKDMQLQRLVCLQTLTQESKHVLRLLTSHLEQPNDEPLKKSLHTFSGALEKQLDAVIPISKRVAEAFSKLNLFAPKNPTETMPTSLARATPATALNVLAKSLHAWLDDVRAAAKPVPALKPPAPAVSKQERTDATNELIRNMNAL